MQNIPSNRLSLNQLAYFVLVLYYLVKFDKKSSNAITSPYNIFRHFQLAFFAFWNKGIRNKGQLYIRNIIVERMMMGNVHDNLT